MKRYNHVLANYCLLLSIGIIWGCQFMLTGIALRDLSFDWLAAARICVGAITLMILFFFTKPKTFKEIKTNWTRKQRFIISMFFAWIAIFQVVIPAYAIAWGQYSVGSSTTSILTSSVPIFVILMARIFIPEEKLSIAMLLSILMGLTGLVVLLLPELHAGDLEHIHHEAAIMFGVFSFSFSMILIQKMPKVPTVWAMRNILVIAAIPMLLYAFLQKPEVIKQIHYKDMWPILLLGVFCSGIVYVINMKLIERSGVSFSSLTNYLVPAFGTLFGITLMHEQVYPYMLVALSIIFLSPWVAQLKFVRKIKDEILSETPPSQ